MTVSYTHLDVYKRQHVNPRARPGRTVAGKHIAVFLPGEVGQLVKSDVVVAAALIIAAILGMLHGAEVDFCPAGKDVYKRQQMMIGHGL